MRNLLIISALLVINAFVAVGARADEARSAYQIDAIPEGYNLQAYDDCGVVDRQPHVHAKDVYTFAANDVQGDEKARSVAWAEKSVDVNFDHLDAKSPYVVAITYANEKFNNRVQSIWAGAVQIQPAHALPKGKSERLFFRVPAEAVAQGKLALQFRLEAQVNVVVSAVELWSTAPSPAVVHLSGVSGLIGDLEGRVLNLAYDPAPLINVELLRPDSNTPLAQASSGADGRFHFPRSAFERIDRKTDLRVVAVASNASTDVTIPAAELFFDPVRYRPLPSVVGGLGTFQQSLNGLWLLKLDAADAGREMQIPGQWIEQGFDVPEDKPAFLSRDFSVPAEWKDHRVILRFDAIHAGTEYRLNGKLLGTSENLFTPVEWDITDAARVGEANHLELKMVVATASERLSSSSGYTGHSLGGIDRAVRIFALPDVHLGTLHLDTGLDDRYENGKLNVELGVTNAGAKARAGLSLLVNLLDTDGKAVAHSAEDAIAIAEVQPGASAVHVHATVPGVLKWNAEQPYLYKLQLDLRDGDKLIERVERNVGFRKIELKGQQFFINGQRVKLAGVARHEADPLSGRADTAKHAEEDVRLLKSANLNYVRTSHYPPTEEFLAAADRLGMYVECEAPFCWVAPASDLTDLKNMLIPTSARVDFCHTHPSIIVWSVANESHWSREFDFANKLTKSLDPTRPTTFNHPFSNEAAENCDIVNRHYLSMPFEDAVPGDPRPFIHGECFFEIYHERKDVAIDPGLRELWARGSADPTSDFAKAAIEDFRKPGLHPGIYPGAWSYIVASNRFIGSVIWSGVDDIMFTKDGKKYSSEAGNAYWGLVDGWRRAKPELWMSKLVFSPVWFPKRQFDYSGGAAVVSVPVENRYSFTNLSELKFAWKFGEQAGEVKVDVAPGQKAQIALPVPKGAKAGDGVMLNVNNAAGELVNAVVIHLGTAPPPVLAEPNAGAPSVKEDGGKIAVQSDQFSFVIDKASGDFDAGDTRHRVPLVHFPRLHTTRFDFGDLEGGAPPYAVLPEEMARKVDAVSVEPRDRAVAISVKDHYADFAGGVTWLIDRSGAGRISYDYIYSGADVRLREIGLRLFAKRAFDELHWNRWSEWDVFPDDSISRTVGTAHALRDTKFGPTDAPESTRPTWPWSLDQTELGTNDFRSIKFNIRSASLVSRGGDGIEVRANADAHVRACLAPDGVLLHILSQCSLSPVTLKKGNHLKGAFTVNLVSSQFAP